MSNRRRPRNPVTSVLDAYAGRTIPGGCDDCLAYQVVEKQAPGVYLNTVHHDAGCPWLAAREREA